MKEVINMNNTADKNYEHLEGKTIMVKSWGYSKNGIVVGVDYDIGITIVSYNNKDELLFCLNGPSSGNTSYNYETCLSEYNSIFTKVAGAIESGTVDFNKMGVLLKNSFVKEISRDFCPFSR
jgi:hypothetical protein